jgi:hypothetical protein
MEHHDGMPGIVHHAPTDPGAYGNNDWVTSYRLLLQTWNAATKSHNTYVVIMKRFVQPTMILLGPEAKVTIDPQNNAKPTHVSAAVHTGGLGLGCDATLFAKPMLTNVNTTGEAKMTTSPPMPCSKLARYLCGSGGKKPAAK